MSADDDTEFRDLLSQTLEMNGCLSKIRAQLRASIFLTLDEDKEIQQKEPLLNKKVKSCLETHEGQTMFCLVREFLEFFNLHYTTSVFDVESYNGKYYNYGGRCQILENLSVLEDDPNTPLLLQILNFIKTLNDSKANSIKNEISETLDFPQPIECSSLNSTIETNNLLAKNINKTYRVTLPDINNYSTESTRNSNANSEDSVSESIRYDKIAKSYLEENLSFNVNCTEKLESDKTTAKTNTLPLTSKDSSKTEKNKPRSNSSCASDLPLPIGKTKSSESQLLPSPYNIDKDKNSYKEVEKSSEGNAVNNVLAKSQENVSTEYDISEDLSEEKDNSGCSLISVLNETFSKTEGASNEEGNKETVTRSTENNLKECRKDPCIQERSN